MYVIRKRAKLWIRILLEYALYAFSLLVGMKKGLVIFSMSNGRYGDNARTLFEYMIDVCSDDLSILWLADEQLHSEIVPLRYRDRLIKRNTIRGLWVCSRSECVVLSHGFADYGIFKQIAKRKTVVMLWHAITTKYCGLLDSKLNPKDRHVYRKSETRYYDILIASSDVDRYYSASYTGMDVNYVKVTGLPRNDLLFEQLEKSGPGSSDRPLLYAPTFRDYPIENGSVFFPFDVKAGDIADWAKSVGISFLLRPHQNDKQSLKHVKYLVSEFPDIFKYGGADSYPDISKLILQVSGIITDYSSTYIDGLILDLPVVFVDFDIDKYISERGIAYDYSLIACGHRVGSWTDFQEACEDSKRGAKGWAEQRENVRSLFFKFRDSNSSSRINDLIQGLIGE